MRSIKLQEIIRNYEAVESFMRLRDIEDWCLDHIPNNKWRFDYSSTLCVCGIDVPGRIFFSRDDDATAFILRFS